MQKWQRVAKAEGRVCPECARPVSRPAWKEMNRTGKTTLCFTCRYAHWEIPLYGAGGSAWRDNQDREAWDRIRGKG